MASVAERVIDIVAEQLGVSKDQINRDTSFVNDLGADSLDTVELVMELEEEFDINIPDDVAEKIQTVGQAIDHIEKATEQPAAERESDDIRKPAKVVNDKLGKARSDGYRCQKCGVLLSTERPSPNVVGIYSTPQSLPADKAWKCSGCDGLFCTTCAFPSLQGDPKCPKCGADTFGGFYGDD